MKDKKKEGNTKMPVKEGGCNYGLDLLRILSMFMIVNLHVLGQGGAMVKIVGRPEAYYAAWFLETCAYCAVNLYGLISGYVGVNSKYRPSRILELWLQVFFYSAGITLIYWIFAPGLLVEGSLWKSILPVSWKTYWYFSAYVGVFFLMPYLNKMVNSLTEKEAKRLALTLFLVFSVGTAVPKVNSVDFLQLIGGYSFAWLLVLYLFGACLKKCSFRRWKNRWYVAAYFGLAAFSWAFKIVVENYTREIYGEARFGRLFTGYAAPTIFLCAVCLFMIFENLKIKNVGLQKMISFASPLAFSVYLIHTQPQIWDNVIKGVFAEFRYLDWWAIIPASLAGAVMIYVVCTLIDVVRSWLFRLMKVRKITEILVEQIRKMLFI